MKTGIQEEINFLVPQLITKNSFLVFYQFLKTNAYFNRNQGIQRLDNRKRLARIIDRLSKFWITVFS